MNSIRKNRALRVLVASLAVFSIASSQRVRAQAWRQQHPTVSPAPRWGASIAFDSARSRLVMFGAYEEALAGETWEWDGTTWIQAHPITSPPPRYLAGMAYDSARGRIVLFAGSGRPGIFLNDTWEWDGVNWVQNYTPTSPLGDGRYVHVLAYDSVRQRTVLFGGEESRCHGCFDTWEYDGTDWQLRSTATRPSAGEGGTLAFDPIRGVSVYFGGAAMIPGNPSSETWEWNGTLWNRPVVTAGPCPRIFGCSAYAADLHQTLLFGGRGLCARPQFYGDTWSWEGTQWNEFTGGPHPQAREWSMMAYDSTRHVTVLFGGADPQDVSLGDTWTFGFSSVTSVSPTSGSEAGGDLVHIRGSGLGGVATGSVTFGGVVATVLSATADEIRARTPAATGLVDVRVESMTLPAAFTYVGADVGARLGNVNEGIGERESVLLANGNTGDLRRELTVGVGQPLDGFMQLPSSRANARYVLYAWIGNPGAGTLVALPHDLGTMVFPAPFIHRSPQPRAILNNIGFGRTLGPPTIPSSPAPSQAFVVRRGIPRAINLAFQGIIQDDASTIPEGYSVTNAVILHVR
ncbi:MAG: IPT/TIG domain-containing protein [Planctomycetes bacterium]|nr:IPT/TIG domain-containing protein [Planctomycetota bacterium]